MFDLIHLRGPFFLLPRDSIFEPPDALFKKSDYLNEVRS